MRIDTDTVYVLENGELAHINLFYAGDETTPAHYQGAVEGHGLTTWRPDGTHMNGVEEWNILRKAAIGHVMQAHSEQDKVENDKT